MKLRQEPSSPKQTWWYFMSIAAMVRFGRTHFPAITIQNSTCWPSRSWDGRRIWFSPRRNRFSVMGEWKYI